MATTDAGGADAAQRTTTHHVTHSQHARHKKHHKSKHKKHHKKHKKTSHKAKPKPVTSCPGYGRFAHLDTYPLIDNRTESSGLVPAIDKLICSAADYSTIDIKSWFIYISDSTLARIVSHLKLMHQYHHVRVNVSARSVGHDETPQQIRDLRSIFSFAHLYLCTEACYNALPNSLTHSKWITVSRLRAQNAPAVLSTSANWSHQQFALTRETGTLTIGHPALYAAFAQRFATYMSCGNGGSCSRARPPLRWVGSPGAYVYFAPGAIGQGDPVSEALDRVVCSPGSFIDVTSLMLTRGAIIRRLTKLRAAGCTVRVLLEHAVTPSLSQQLTPRCETNHDKSMLIESPTVRMAIAGSEDFGGGGIYNNDNQMVMTNNAWTRGYLEKFFLSNWYSSSSCQITHESMAKLRKLPED